MSPLDVPFAVALVVLSIVVLALFAYLEHTAPATPPRSRPPGTPTPATPCRVSGCPFPALVWVFAAIPGVPTLEALKVCHGCADEGTCKRWWARSRDLSPRVAS